jgi:hypothetical protein
MVHTKNVRMGFLAGIILTSNELTFPEKVSAVTKNL